MLLPLLFHSFGQSSLTDSSFNPARTSSSRMWIVAGTHAAFLVGSYVLLNKAWYEDFPKQKFHFFDDLEEWNQVDKCGHLWTCYTLSRVSAASWKWTGLTEKKSVVLGSLTSLTYQSIIEVLDGYSTDWGFSWRDMAANVIGASTFAFQQVGWHDQRIQIKFSYHPYDYPDELIERRNELYGDGYMERMLKDYNSQTYWASVNLKSFFKKSNLPAWLNVSFGYGAQGILGGFENKWQDKNGNTVTRYDINRVRQFYFAPDIDLTKIRTRSKFLRSVFFVVNMIKVPAPTISWDSKGTCRLYAIYF